MVFLGVLFFLSLIWTKIPDLGKLLLGFVIGIGVYFVGVFLNKKDLKGEAMVLL
ncbi:MAG: hypothetical protein LBD11_02910 [Candidatus Peribacteria bacterium]|nr:hypothetical protein [Candidatus Peribacteria bacterium]